MKKPESRDEWAWRVTCELERLKADGPLAGFFARMDPLVREAERLEVAENGRAIAAICAPHSPKSAARQS